MVPLYLIIFDNHNSIFFTIMFVLIFYTHRENVKRLKNKEETKTEIYWFDYQKILSNFI